MKLIEFEKLYSNCVETYVEPDEFHRPIKIMHADDIIKRIFGEEDAKTTEV